MLDIVHLRKEFETVVAVNDVSFKVRAGEIFGFLGPNGAGKTTTLRTILNIIQPDSGEILIDGRPFSPEIWNSIGYLPEERGLYRKSRILDTIAYFGGLKGLDEREAKQRGRQWLKRLGLAERWNSKVEELSKGNQQKIQFIISILHEPKLLILDEPFSGLDPKNQLELKEIFLELHSKGVTIIFSTHQMEQAEKMCENILLIDKGRKVLDGSLADIKRLYGANTVRLEFDGDGQFLKQLPMVKRADVYQNSAELELDDVNRAQELLAATMAKVQLKKYEIGEPSLHSIFLKVTGATASQPQEVVV